MRVSLYDVPASTGLYGFEDLNITRVGREDDDLGIGELISNPGDGFRTV